MQNSKLKKELKTLNKNQEQAVFHESGRAVCIAGPGSGKTRVITMRAIRLVSEKYEGKAGNNTDKTNENNGKKTVLTMAFNKAAAEEMRQRAADLAEKIYGENCAEITDQMHFSTIHSYCFEIIRLYCKEKHQKTPTVVSDAEQNEMLDAIYKKITGGTLPKEVRRRIVSFCETEEKNEDDPLIYKIAKEYENLKTQNNAIDFADMQKKALAYLTNDAKFCNKIKSRFEFTQIDEAQDLSGLQAKIIAKISAGNDFFVADDDQSIYGFRGARPEILKKTATEGENAAIYRLLENYRSNSEIVEFAKSFIEQNPSRFKKELKSVRGEGGGVRLMSFETAENQAEFIAEKIISEAKKGKTSCVLYRNNASNIIPTVVLYFALKNTKTGKKTAINPGIMGEKNVLAENQVISGVCEAVKNEAKKHRGFFRPSVLTIYEKMLKENKLDGCFFQENSGKRRFYAEELRQTVEILCKNAEKPEDILKNAEKIDEFTTLGDKAQVLFSTIHSIKGLEYDNVFVIDCVKGEFPSGDIKNPKILDEERRLMYVAMTRAKNRLYICFPGRCGNMRLTAGKFVDEIECIFDSVEGN